MTMNEEQLTQFFVWTPRERDLCLHNLELFILVYKLSTWTCDVSIHRIWQKTFLNKKSSIIFKLKKKPGILETYLNIPENITRMKSELLLQKDHQINQWNQSFPLLIVIWQGIFSFRSWRHQEPPISVLL